MKNFKLLLKWGKRYQWMIFTIFFTTIILQMFYSYIPLMIQYGIKALEGVEIKTNLPDFYIELLEKQQGIMSVLLCLSISIIVLQAIRSFLRFLDSYLRGATAENIAHDMRDKLYKHIDQLSYTYHNNADIGDLIQRCTSDIDTSSVFLSNQIPEILNIIATISIGAYQVGHINLTLMWVSMIIIPIAGISSIVFFKYVCKQFDLIEKEESKMTTIIQENLNASRVVKAFSREKYEFDKMDKQSKKYRDMNIKFNTAFSLYWGFSDMSVMLQYVFTIAVGIFLNMNGYVDAADIAACLMLLDMLIWPIRELGRIISDFGKTLVAVSRIQEILNIPSEYLVNGTEKPLIKGNISFKDVTFKFSDSEEKLLNGLTFDIKAGQVIAIVGKTGSGKSTIANLLTRMLDYNSGSIKVDGVELKSIEKHYIRKNIGIVLQDPFLFSKSIYENISIANKNIEKEKVYEAAEVASIHKDILEFEKGYDTLVGEKGTTLSGGQKQRVAIARILTSNKPVIIFDDSLSAVDTETDIMIRKALKEKRKDITMIIITHRTTTAKEADKIIVLDKGIVAEQGTHDQLVKNNGLYSKLWGIQGQLETEFLKVLGGE